MRRQQLHEAPTESCACGIYATTSLRRLASYLNDWNGRTRYVFGRVRLWGTVIECDHGWRAAYAYPAEILVPTSVDGSTARASADALAAGLREYGVPVAPLPHTPAEALAVVERERGRDGALRSGR